MKIFMLNYDEDLPVAKIERIIQKAINIYKSGIIVLKNK